MFTREMRQHWSSRFDYYQPRQICLELQEECAQWPLQRANNLRWVSTRVQAQRIFKIDLTNSSRVDMEVIEITTSLGCISPPKPNP